MHLSESGDPIIEILDPADPGGPPIPPDDDDLLTGDIDDLGMMAGVDFL